ncbi:MAG: peptidoglycan bridge formation glycyltransferase FemA/FemB family protein [Candidatus Rokubacteria bacterium]|nr:peptidoglycan bridge formation glycyltransferase FemA/FemB family protein [Candidatus Rokubacteria bacterium]
MTTMGYHPLYLFEGDQRALALVRGWTRGVRRVIARANLFAAGVDGGFVTRAVEAMAQLGVSYVRVGDSMWGLGKSETTNASHGARTTVIQRHTFVLDLAQSEEMLLRNQGPSVRTSVRKAERAGVEVREITTSADLEAYCALARGTSARVRSVSAYTDFPTSFFTELFKRMTGTGAAKFYLACIDATPVAGAIFLCSKERMLYFAGASTRDRAYTALQAPTAVLWHAIRGAKRLGLSRFDFGGCTPTEDPRDPRYGVYAFKRRWGGDLETFYNLEVVVAPALVWFQDRVLSPLWNRVHPFYFRLLELRKALP